MPTLTQEQVDTLRDVCYTTDTKLLAYSGRVMYGKMCVGIVVENAGDLLSIGSEIQKTDPDLARLLGENRARVDSMGRDREVVYWEYVNANGTDLADDDEEDED